MRMASSNISIIYTSWPLGPIHSGEFVSWGLRLCYMLCGSIEWEINGEICTASEGDVAVFAAGDRRKMIRTVGNVPPQMCIISMAKDNPAHAKYTNIFSARSDNIPRLISAVAHPQISRLFFEANRECMEGGLYSDEIFELKILTALALIAKQYSITNIHETKNHYKIKTATEHIDLHYCEDIKLEDVANMFSMTPSGFSKAFKKANGISPVNYILKKRIDRALHMLKTSQKTIIEIALECGFNNSASFYQAFRKITGKRPKDFRIKE